MKVTRWGSIAGGLVLVIACSSEPGTDQGSPDVEDDDTGDVVEDDQSDDDLDPDNPASMIEAPPHVPVSGALRLTRAEIDATLGDVLGANAGPSGVLAEDEFSPYDNGYDNQVVSQALVDGLQVMAEDVAAGLIANVEQRDHLLPCTPASASDAACFDQTVEQLGSRLLRRPFSADDVAHYRPLLEFATESDDFYAAVELLLQSLLQDPEFVYRIERGSPTMTAGVFALDAHEIATRMSFMLLGTTPDAGLLHDSSLTDGESRRAVTAQLLEDPRAQRQLNRFHSMWLGYRAIPHDAELNAAFQAETEALIERVVFDQAGDFLQLFSSPETYLTTALAEHYGLPPPDNGEGWVSYPTDSGRAGILSQGSVLSGFSKFTDTSPTQRGIFVQTRLLCNEIPPPPPTVDVDQPPGENEAACKVDRYLAHKDQSGCAACHDQFDPIGLGLEHFDMAGRYREHDDGAPECVLDTVGTLPGYGEFEGPAELAELLVDNNLVAPCFVQHYARFILGRVKLSSLDKEYTAVLAEQFESQDRRVSDWLTELVADPVFALRREEAP